MNLFVYGTLLVPEIWERVAGVSGLASRPARLRGHLIRRVRGAVYPGIVPAPKAEAAAEAPVAGRVFFEVPDAALARLDSYEDDFYFRAEVRPEIPGLGDVAAEAYLVRPDRAGEILSSEGWSLEWFERHGLDGFRQSLLSA